MLQDVSRFSAHVNLYSWMLEDGFSLLGLGLEAWWIDAALPFTKRACPASLSQKYRSILQGTVLREGLARAYKGLIHEYLAKVFCKSVLQDCLASVSCNSVKQECLATAFSKSILQERFTKVLVEASCIAFRGPFLCILLTCCAAGFKPKTIEAPETGYNLSRIFRSEMALQSPS